MTPAGLEVLLRVALPPLKLALRERYLVVRRQQRLGGQQVNGGRRPDRGPSRHTTACPSWPPIPAFP